MAQIIEIETYVDDRGKLSVLEKNIPFEIKRVFYIYDVDDLIRGRHRHHKTIQAAICIHGACKITNNDSVNTTTYNMDKPNKCLFLYPEDYHWMHDFSDDAVLLVLASESFDPNDYIYEPYS